MSESSRNIALEVLKKERDGLAEQIRNQSEPERKKVSIYRLTIIDKMILVLDQMIEENKVAV